MPLLLVIRHLERVFFSQPFVLRGFSPQHFFNIFLVLGSEGFDERELPTGLRCSHFLDEFLVRTVKVILVRLV